MLLNSFLILVQGWSCFSPTFSVVKFFSYYVELPIMLVMFVGWKILERTKLVSAEDMDLETDAYTIEAMTLEERDAKIQPRWRTRVEETWRWFL